MNQKAWIPLVLLFMTSCLLAGCASTAAPASPSIPLILASETPVSASFAKKLPSTTETGGLAQLGLMEETNHCMIYYAEGEQISASYIGGVLEDNLERVGMDLGYHLQEKMKVLIYPDLETFHKAIAMPDAPEWVIAAGYVDGIQMVTPRLISSDLLEKTIIHELTHVLQGQINPNAPFWMIEGLAAYESGMSEGVRERVTQGIQAKNIPSLASLETMDTAGFEKAGGYEYGYTVVEYAVHAYGTEILKEWVKSPRDYKKVFGVSAETFERDWLNDLSDRYDGSASNDFVT